MTLYFFDGDPGNTIFYILFFTFKDIEMASGLNLLDNLSGMTWYFKQS